MSEVLIPSRDFEYIYMPFEILEESQCGTCVFRKKDSERNATFSQNASWDGSMCFDIESQILMEDEPVPEVTNYGKDNLVCTKYRKGDPTPDPVEGQGELF